MALDWLREDNWSVARPDWRSSFTEGFPPSDDDRSRALLVELMAPINRALNEVNVHANERWTNESKKNVDLDKLRSKDRVSAPYSSTSLGGSSLDYKNQQPGFCRHWTVA
jgi:hypothetical protein